MAVFPPAAVAVFAEHPHGSPRNVVPVRLAAVEPRGDLVRLRAGVRDGGPAWAEGLAADVTPGALVDLPAEPGAELWFAVKATEVAIHPAGHADDRAVSRRVDGASPIGQPDRRALGLARPLRTSQRPAVCRTSLLRIRRVDR